MHLYLNMELTKKQEQIHQIDKLWSGDISIF